MMKKSFSILGDYCEVTDCEHKTAPTIEHGYPLIRTPNIGRGTLILDNVYRVSNEIYAAWTRRRRPEPGDLIMAREAPVGNVAIIPQGLSVALGQRTVLLRVTRTKELNPAYLNYLLNSDGVHTYLNALSNGATVGHLNVGDIRKLRLPVFPPIQVQKKIASILSAYDDLIENNKRRIAILEKMAEEIYREWFVRMRFPGHASSKVSKGLPAGWQILPLSSLAKEMRTGVKRKDLSESELYVGLEHITRKSILLDQWSTVASVDSDKLRFVEGDILFGKIRPYLHKIVLSHVTGACSTDTIVLRPIKKDYTGLLLFTVFSDTFVDLATTASKGTKMPRADWAFLKKLKIKVPSDSLLLQFSSIFETLFAEMVTLAKMNSNLLKSRDLLLPRLISGKLSVEDLDLPSNEKLTAVSSALPQQELAHA